MRTMVRAPKRFNMSLEASREINKYVQQKYNCATAIILEHPTWGVRRIAEAMRQTEFGTSLSGIRLLEIKAKLKKRGLLKNGNTIQK